MTTRAMTYAELGAALGITAASAKRLAVRNRWKKAVGNDGRSRVNVPVERLEAARDIPNDTSGDDTSAGTGDITGSVTSDARALIVHLQEAAADLRARLDKAEVELSDLRPLAAELARARAQVDAERRRAEDAAAAAAALVAAEKGRAADMAAHAAAMLEAEKARSEELREALEQARARRWFQIFRRP